MIYNFAILRNIYKMSLVYIGCGSDFEPVIRLPEVKKFIYIDSQPQSEHGWMEYGTKLFYRRNYPFEFAKNIPEGFYKTNIDDSYPNVYHDCFNDRTIFHYYSLPFPWDARIYHYHITKKDINLLEFYISQATHLAICGHSPHNEILNMLPKKFTLVTNNNTCYPKNEIDVKEMDDGYPTVSSDFIQKPITQKRISEVKYLTNNSVKTLSNYVEFMLERYV